MSRLDEVRRRVAEKNRIMTPPAEVEEMEDLSFIEDEIDEACALYKRMKDKAFTDNRWESETLDMLRLLEDENGVFSNMNPSKWVVVGESSKLSNEILETNGVNMDFFYITNVVKSFPKQLEILKPHLVVALGGDAFNMLAPECSIKTYSGKIIASDKFGVKVFPIDTSDKKKFTKGLTMLCRLIKKF